MKRNDDAIRFMESGMTPEEIREGREAARREILKIRLAELRALAGKNQDELPSFTQTAVCKLEKRADIKLSTLATYLNDLGFSLEIIAHPREKKPGVPDTVAVMTT